MSLITTACESTFTSSHDTQFAKIKIIHYRNDQDEAEPVLLPVVSEASDDTCGRYTSENLQELQASQRQGTYAERLLPEM